MKVLVRSAIAAAALAATALPISSASAMPAAPIVLSAPEVILASGGCGPYAHRGFYGYCRPNVVGYGYGYGYGWHRPWGWHRWGGWRRW